MVLGIFHLKLVFSPSRNRVLQRNDGLEFGLGSLQLELAGTLFLGWVIVYLIICRGLHQSGYIIWFTALFPYVVMITLLIRAVTLDGAIDGLKAYVHVSLSGDLVGSSLWWSSKFTHYSF